LHFVHVHFCQREAAANKPHTEFAMGPALSGALKELDTAARRRSTAAAQHFRDFCAKSAIAICDGPGGPQGVTASWQEEEGHALRRIIFRARHHDLVVIGRAKKANGLPPDFIEQLLVAAGRPVLIANAKAPPTLTGTIMVCWKETAEAARAVSAAMPFLAHAKRVVVASIPENGEDPTTTAGDVARQLAWNGVPAETRIVPAGGRPVPELLASTAQECDADLVVLGAYGRSRMHEVLFGSCTQAVIRNADRTVLLMH
jgi:nucleotide-binding universal stress UspA family protein